MKHQTVGIHGLMLACFTLLTVGVAHGDPASAPKHPRTLGALFGFDNQPTTASPNPITNLRKAWREKAAARAEAARLKQAAGPIFGDPAHPVNGTLVKDAHMPIGDVYYDGFRNPKSNLPRVFVVVRKGFEAHGLPAGMVMEGTRQANGTILWDGQPLGVKGSGLEPLPANKAPSTLVITDDTKIPKPTTVQTAPRGSGQAEVTSRYTDHIIGNPNPDGTNFAAGQAPSPPATQGLVRPTVQSVPPPKTPDLVKPSQWREYMKLTNDQATELGKKSIAEARRFGRGVKNLAFPQAQGGNAGGDLAINMNALPASAAAFAAALGASAAIHMAFDSANHPLAADQYHDIIHDEVTWLSMGALVITQNYFLTKPLFSDPSAPLWKKSAGFGGVMTLGMLLNAQIWAFANDPDIRACGSFSNYHKTGNPMNNGREFPAKARDMKACDRAYANPHLREIAVNAFVNQFLPQAAASWVTGALFYAALYQVGRVVTFEKVLGTLGTLTGGLATKLVGSSSVPGLAFQFGMAIGAQAALYAVMERSAPITSYIGKQRAARYTYQSGLYAETPYAAENALFNAWKRVKESGWKNPSDVSGVKDICYDPHRLGSKYVDCARKDEADLEGALATYHAQQNRWREIALAPIRKLYEEWKTKATSYHDLFNYARGFYKEAVAKIVYTLQHPNAPAEDPMVFNLANMNVTTETPYIPAALRSAFFSTAAIETFDGTWAYLATPNVSEYMLASLACGTEVETPEAPSWIEFGQRLLGNNVIGVDAPPPREMLVNAVGHKVMFNPPRITNAMEGNRSVCEFARQPGAIARWVKGDVSNFQAFTPQKTYNGLTSYILENVRPTVVAPGAAGLDANRLDAWWSTYIQRRDDEVNAQLAEEYQTVVDKKFIPALVNPSYQWRSAHDATKGSRLEEYMLAFGTPAGGCGATSLHCLADGLLNNLRDQSRLYVAMMIDLNVSNPTAFGESATTPELTRLSPMMKGARTLLAAYDAFSVEYARNADPESMNQTLKEMATAFVAFKALANKGDVSAVGPAHFQREWMIALTNDLKESLSALSAYVQLASLPRVNAGGQ